MGNRSRPRRSLQCWGGARELKRRSLAPHPTPSSNREETRKVLTDADHFRIMKQASVASLRC